MKVTTIVAAIFILSAAVRSESTLPVLIWYGPAPTGEIRNDLQIAASAGFSRLLFTAKEPGINLQLLGDADDLGLHVYLSDAAVDAFISGDPSLRRLDSLTQLYSGYRSFRGFILYDKPGMKELKNFAELADFFAGKYPSLESFIQIHPLYAAPARLDTTDYDVYLAQFTEKITPPLIAYEHAAFTDNRLRAEFFQNLNLVRNISIKRATPFWAFVLLDPVGQPPLVPHSHIRVQIYSGLAYGAKGVHYFAYRPAGASSAFPNASILDTDGRTAQTYFNCAVVNAELRRLAPVIMNLKSGGVYMAKPAPTGVANLPPNLVVTKIDAPGVLIGMFCDPEGQEYVMLVNTDVRTGKRFRVYFAPEVVGLTEIAKDDAPPYRVRMRSPETDDYADLLLKAGDGRLFKILK